MTAYERADQNAEQVEEIAEDLELAAAVRWEFYMTWAKRAEIGLALVVAGVIWKIL